MRTYFHNWYVNFAQLNRRRFWSVRRKPQQRWTTVEGLENRALLSAMNSFNAPTDQQVVSVGQQIEANSPQQAAHEDSLQRAEPVGTELKFGSLKQQHNSAKQKGKADYSGDWNLGISGTPPSDQVVLHVQQTGKKFQATISQDGQGTIGYLTGRVRKGEFVAEITVPTINAVGTFVVHKVSDTELVGIVTMNVDGQGSDSGTVLGEKSS